MVRARELTSVYKGLQGRLIYLKSRLSRTRTVTRTVAAHASLLPWLWLISKVGMAQAVGTGWELRALPLGSPPAAISQPAFITSHGYDALTCPSSFLQTPHFSRQRFYILFSWYHQQWLTRGK